MNTYKVFKRSATNWSEFLYSNKRTVRRGLSYEEARSFCVRENAERTPAEIKRGMKYEFEQE